MREGLPDSSQTLLARLATHLKELEQQVLELEHEIQDWHKNHGASRKRALSGAWGRLPLALLSLLWVMRGILRTDDNGPPGWDLCQGPMRAAGNRHGLA